MIKDKRFPTGWEGVYLYPNKKKQLDQLQRLKTSIQRYASDTFKDRLRIFYTDTYIQEYVSKLVEINTMLDLFCLKKILEYSVKLVQLI